MNASGQRAGTGIPHGNGAADPADTVDLRAMVAVWLRRRWLVAGVAAVVAAGFAVRWVATDPRYRAAGTLQVEPDRPSVPGLGLDVPAVRTVASPIQSQIEIIRSRSLLDAVVDSLGLRAGPRERTLPRAEVLTGVAVATDAPAGEFVLALGDSLRITSLTGAELATGRPGVPLRVSGVEFTVPVRDRQSPRDVPIVVRPLREASDALGRQLSVSHVRETNLISVAAEDPDPALAAAIVNATMDLAIRQSIARRREQASARRRFIESQIADFEAQLAAAQRELQAFQESIGVLRVESEEAGQIANILAFERQLEEIRLERGLYDPVLAELRRDSAGERVSSRGLEYIAASQALLGNAAVGDLHRRLTALEATRDSMRAAPLGPGSATLVGIEGQVAAAQRKLVEAIRQYVDGLDRRMAALRNTVGRLRSEAEALLPRAAELDRRTQRVASLRTILEALQTQLEQTRIEEAAEGGDLRIIDRAVVPLAPANALRAFDVVVALAVTLLLALGAALAVEHFDDRIRTPDELRRFQPLALLGGIPELKSRNGRSRDAAALVTEEDPESGPAEAYRMLRTNLSFALRVSGRRMVLVTSPGPGEGKTTTAANLALSVAQQGQAAVLVDADLRRAAVHRTFGTVQGPGLSEVLLGEASWQDVLRETAHPHLSVLPSGALPPNPAELLGGGRAAEVFRQLGEVFPHVIVDSPPVLAVADAALLAQALDATILVVRIGRTHREAVAQALEQLQMAEARVLGVVANALRAGPGYQSRYYRYATYRQPA